MNVEDLIAAFDDLPDWEERYRMIIDLGRSLPPMPEDLKTDSTRVPGCLSHVWMVAKPGQAFDFWVDSDSALIKGLAAVLHLILAGRSREDLSSVDVDGIFKRLDLENHITPNRRNGFFSMVNKIKALGGPS